MRVLTVIESLGHGGAEQLLLNVLPELQARGHRCDVVTLWPPYKPRGAARAAFSTSRSLRPDFERAGIRVHALPWSYSRRWEMTSGAARVASLARRLGADVVHAHLLFADLYVGLARPLLPMPTVATLHGLDFNYFRSSLPGRVVGRILPTVLHRGFDALAAVAPPVAEHFQENVPGLGIETIFNAVPLPDLSRPIERSLLRDWGADPERFVLLMPARLSPEKNHRTVMEALEILRERGVAPQVLAAGVGPLQEELRSYTRERKLGGQFLFCGQIEHATLQNLMRAADATLLPSTYEGLPMALAEAMACARPVLSTPVGGIPHLVQSGQSGLLVPPQDAQALAVGIEELMQSATLRRNLGQAARVTIEEKFSTRVIAQEWEAFYQQAAARRAW